MRRHETSEQNMGKKTPIFAMRMCLKETHHSGMEVTGPQVILQVPLEVPLLPKE